MLLLTLMAACGLALVHLLAGKLHFLGGIPRSIWLSAAGGISVAYVFLHLLPELGRGQQAIQETVEEGGGWLEHLVYLAAFAGLTVFYGMERTARRARRRHGGQGPGLPVFRLHMTSFAVYNVLIGYLLVHDIRSPRELAFFFCALALHFLVNDFGLQEHYRQVYAATGRWILAGAVLIGWATGIAIVIPEPAMVLLIAFVAGGIVLNVLKEELPEERDSRFSAFLLGGTGYAMLLLAL
jgi:hypothetical protein